MKLSKIFEVYEDKKRIYTVNLIPSKKVYDEKLVNIKGKEYREWNPRKSKLGAMILKACPNIFFRRGNVVLYLGCASGTTVSHVSDIIGREGFIFAVDIGPIVLRKLMLNCKERTNIAPILTDAQNPKNLMDKVCQVDILYQDIAQRNQCEIFMRNIDMFLKKDGYAMIAVKARSVDISKRPKQIFKEVKKELEKKLTIIDFRILDPFQRDHCMFIVKKK